MKPRFITRLSCPFSSAIAALLAMSSAHAATYYWDNNSNTAGYGTATGTWAAPTAGPSPGWSVSNAGTATPASVTTTTADALNFGLGTTGNGLGAGTITVSSVSAGSMTYGSLSGTILLTGGTINLAPVETITVSNASDEINSALTGASGILTKAGTGTLTLSGANTYTGSTVISAGTLSLANNLALQNSVLDTLNSAVGGAAVGLKTTVTTLTLGGLAGNKSIASVFTTTSGGYSGVTDLTLNPGVGVSTSYSGILADGASGMNLIKTGGGTQVLSGLNSYTGTTTVSAGTLVSTAATALPEYTISGKVVFNGGTVGTQVGGSGWTTAQVDALLSNATKTSGALGIDTSNGDLTQWTAFTTSNLGSTLGVDKLGNNTLTLNQINTYTGTTVINAGTLKLQDTGTGYTQTLASLTLSGADVTLQSDNAGSGTLSTTFSALTARAAGNSANIVSTGGSNGSTNVINLTGSAGFIDKGFFFDGGSYAALDATNTFVRALAYGTDTDAEVTDTITASKHVKLTAAVASQPTISLLSLNLSGGGVDFAQAASTTLTVPGIIKSGGATVSTISGGTAVTGGTGVELVVRTDTASDLLTLSTPVAGTGPLTKAGAGTLTLSGVNTYSGNTFVNGGMLAVGGAGTLGSGTYAGAITLANAASFNYSSSAAQTLSGAITLSTGTSFNFSSSATSTLSGVISGAGTLANSAGILKPSGVNTYTGGTLISGGKVDASSGSSSALGTGTITFNASAQFQPYNGGVANSFSYPQDITLNNGATVSFGGNGQYWFKGNVTGNGGITASTFNFGSVVNLSGTNNTFTGPIIIGPGGSGGNWYNVSVASLADSATANGMIELANGSTYASSGRSDGFIWTGATNLVLNNRQLVVASTTTQGGSFYNNSTNNSSITINTPVTGGLGSFVAGPRILSLGGTSTGVNTIAGAIVDGTSVTLAPTVTAGTWVFSNANTYTGATTIAGGTLSLTNALALQNTALNTTGSIAGTASVGLKTTQTALTLGGLTGTKNFAATGGVFNTSSGGYSSVTALTLNPGTGVTNSYAGIIADGAVGMTLTQTGTGTQILTGTNSYTGATTVSSGTLLVNSPGSLNASSSVGVTGGTLGGTGTINGSVTVAAAGSLTPGASTAGTLSIGGTLDISAPANGGAGKLNFTIDTPATSTKLAVTGKLTIGSGVLGFNDFVFAKITSWQAGTYTLITSGGINSGDTLDPANLSGPLGAFTGTLRINGNNLELAISMGYASWQLANSTTGGLNQDHDNDGVPNGIEYFLGGPNANTTGFTAVPAVINTGGVFSITWPKGSGYAGVYGTDFVVETSATLNGDWADETLVGGQVIDSSGSVKYTFPTPLGSKKFARLKVTGP